MQYIVSVHKFECCIGPSFCECSVAATAYPDNDLSVTKVIYKVKGKPISGQSTAWKFCTKPYNNTATSNQLNPYFISQKIVIGVMGDQ